MENNGDGSNRAKSPSIDLSTITGKENMHRPSKRRIFHIRSFVRNTLVHLRSVGAMAVNIRTFLLNKSLSTVSLRFVAITAIALFIAASVRLMFGLDFNDETEKLVTAWLIQDGMHLYREIFVQHGPFVYMLSHLFYLMTGTRDLFWPRLIPLTLSLLSILAVAASPAFRTNRQRLLAITLTSTSYSALLALYSLVMTMYQVYSGYLFAISLSLALLPAAMGVRLKPWHLLASGAALAAMGLNAISFGITIVFACLVLVVAYLPDRKETVRVILWTSFGAALMVAVVGLWMLRFGDFVGFFIDHVYINLTAYRNYLNGYSFTASLRLLLPWQPWLRSVPPGHTWLELVYYSLPFFAIVALLVAELTIRNRRWWHSAATISLLYLSLVFCNPRYSLGFGASTYLIVIAVFVVTTALAVMETPQLRIFSRALVTVLLGAGLLAQFTVRTSLYELSVASYYSRRGALFERREKEYALARTVVGKTDRVLQVPFDLNKYVWINRDPAFGIYYWMPWMHDYGQSPVAGHPLDLCADVEKSPPKLIYFRDFAVWRQPTDVWMRCLKRLVKARYALVGALGEGAMVRADILADRPDLLRTAMIAGGGLDLSLLTPAQRQSIESAKLELHQIRDRDSCLADGGIPGGDEKIVALPCDSDPAVEIVRRTSVERGVKELETGLCLTRGDTHNFETCDPSSSAQAFFVEMMPEDGTLYIRDSLGSGHCVANPAESFASIPCGPKSEWRSPHRQEFALRPVGKKRYQLVSGSNGWCIEVKDASQKEGAGLRLWPCTGAANQAFYVNRFPDGKLELRNIYSDRCISVSGEKVSQQLCTKSTRFRQD